MLRFALHETGRLALGLLGAMLTAAAISALAVTGATRGTAPFLHAMGVRLIAFLHLQFGQSAMSGLPVMTELGRSLPMTLSLVLTGAVIAFALGIPLGLLFGTGPLRRASAPLIQIVAAAPLFCAGLALAYLAQHVLHWPISIDNPMTISSGFFHMSPHEIRLFIPPALIVGAAGAAAVQIALRRSAAEATLAPYRTGLRRLGLTAIEIDRVYVAPQIFAGLLLDLGEVMLALLSAAAVAEWVFNCPGAADLFVKSVALRDWNVAALVLFLFSGATFLADFVGRIAARGIVHAGDES
jgi:peptide/nickel transport system permease protein